MGKNDSVYFEKLDPHIQKVIIDLIASIIENKRSQKKEEQQE